MAQSFVLSPVISTPEVILRPYQDTSFSVGSRRSWAPAWTDWVLPWTLVRDKPGIATVAVDLSSLWGGHTALAALRASGTFAGRAWRALEATYWAVALKLGVNPHWIAEVIGAVDIAAHNLWQKRIEDFVDANTGGLVFKVQQGWFVDP